MAAAEIFGELRRKPLRRCGVELTWHIDEQDVLCADGIDVERGCDSGVNAARDADDNALHVDALQKFLHGIAQHAVLRRNRRLLRRREWRGHRLSVDDGDPLRVGGAHEDALTVRVVCVGSSREGVDGLAPVLKPERIDIKDGGSVTPHKLLCTEAVGEGGCVGGNADVLVLHIMDEGGVCAVFIPETVARDLLEHAVLRHEEGTRHFGDERIPSCAAEEYGNAVRFRRDFLGIEIAVAHECGVFPPAAEKEPRECERREDGDVCTRRLCLLRLLSDRLCIEVGTAGDDLHGYECNFHDMAPCICFFFH